MRGSWSTARVTEPKLTASFVLLYSSSCRVRKQLVNVPSFMVRLDSQKHIDFSLNSPFGGGRSGRRKRKTEAAKGSGGGGAGDEEDD